MCVSPVGPGCDSSTPAARITRRCLLMPSKSRSTTVATWLAVSASPDLSICKICQRNGLASAANTATGSKPEVESLMRRTMNRMAGGRKTNVG